jgi:D-alanine transaminase
MDRGFLFGDGVYEVIPAYGGHLLRLPHHLARLQNSLDGIKLANPLSAGEWESVVTELLRRNRDQAGDHNDQSVYLQVTRGPEDRRDHRFPAATRPTVFAYSTPIAPVDPALAEDGIAAVTLDDTRWQMCHIKAITLLPNVLLRQQAAEQEAGEAILIRDGQAIEGSASNLFVVSGGVIVTPPKGPLMLPGITRDLVLELAEKHGLPCKERPVTESELQGAGEIWLTSSTREIIPVTRLDGKAVGGGVPGPVWKTMIEHYHSYKEAVRSGNQH